jgi:Cyclin, N-terminal domain
MNDLRCNENVNFMEEDDNEDLGGIRSFADPTLLDDQRVLTNVLARCWKQPRTPDYFGTVQTTIKPHMRKIVVGWMLDVTEEQSCHPEVFALAVNYLDRVLSLVEIKKNQVSI